MPNRTIPADSPQFHAERISAALHDQHVGGLVSLSGRLWRVVFLQTGAAQIAASDGGAWTPGPALMWLPWSPGLRLRVRAGSSGATLLLSEQMLANTLGHKPEAADLRLMLHHPVRAALTEARGVRDDIDQCFRLILREAAEPRPGSATLVEAQCRVIAVLLWRLLLRSDDGRRQVSGDLRNLQVFRTLLEAHFRRRRTVASYAEAMGMSADRLHDLCRRALGKPPGALIRERLGYEAQLLLTRSAQPLGTIAGQLGFVDAPQFSKFFRREFGEPPGRYRRRMATERSGTERDLDRSFADWP